MPNGVGVIIARFQVPELTDNHASLIDHVANLHEDVIVLLGVTQPSKRNPLSFAQRSIMVTNYNQDVACLPLPDGPCDYDWSRRVDSLLDTTVPFRDVTLYGGPDSFIPHYKGRFKTVVVSSTEGQSGTEARQAVLDVYGGSQAFREGVIWGQQARFNRAYPCVDIAIYDLRRHAVLMARKAVEANKTGYRFVGGFVDPTDGSLESAARREAREETGVEVGPDLMYVGSAKIDDWRYRGTGDGIISSVFVAHYLFGKPEAADDISLVEWVPVDQILTRVLPVHQGVAELVAKALSR